ncbi:hypothetical protein D0T49_01765 [Paludibacter sp. 221]|uniref:hypothetical protein n=1 Tax=Paludibacter sp. 221 TaxID=2302939 RepID=UPI0013D0205E|nr:hypothetical protein [Paludibacter sp. 221]NDV45778.1 hypothetical protein [Paludibacter sp. 221]
MENALISKATENKIISDLQKIIESGKKGKVMLADYVGANQGACMDFAVLYEASDDLRYFIKEQQVKGAKIDIQEDSILVE